MKYKITIIIVLIIAGYTSWAATRPLPVLQPTLYQTTQTPQTKIAQLKWPSYGGQAVGVTGYGVLATHGNQKPQPTASVAKVMVALAILHKKPLAINEHGPLVPITKHDEAMYKQGLASFQSGVAVETGEKLTEYQALQALLIASANNLATTLTNWAYGSQKQYLEYANDYAALIGMKQTHFADASGLSAKTVSTPSDLVRLGEASLSSPVITQIVAQHSATIPVAGKIKNFNVNLINDSNINGIKTGNTTEAGGCFLFSLDYGHDHKLVGVIMKAPTLGQALTDSIPFSKSLADNIVTDKVISVGQKVGYYSLPWGGQVDALASQDITLIHLRGGQPRPTTNLYNFTGLYTNQQVGLVSLEANGHNYESRVYLNAVTRPTLAWRLLHP